MKGDRAGRQREPVENNEQREQVRGLEFIGDAERRQRRRMESENHTVPPNRKKRPTENDERLSNQGRLFNMNLFPTG